MKDDVQEPPADVVLDVTETATSTSSPSKEAEKPEEAPKAKAALVSVERGILSPKNQLELGAVLSQISTGKGFPELFDTKEKRLAAYHLGASLMGDQWMLAVNNMYYMKGKLCIFGELPGTIAERTGEVAQKRCYLVNKDYQEICVKNKNLLDEPFAGVCDIQRKGRTPNSFFYTVEEAKKAGQLPAKKRDGSPNPDSPWEKHMKVMLMRKAMGQGVKFEFPEALVGVPIAEDYDEAPDLIKDVTPVDKAAQLNRAFSPQNVEKNVAQEVQ